MRQLKTLKLVRTTAQAILSVTHTAISWSSVDTNTGPASWWSSGTPERIVMPWAGLYLFDFACVWTASATGFRAAHINKTTTISTSNFVAGTGHYCNATSENSWHDNWSTVVYAASAGDIYQLTVYSSTSSQSVQANAAFPLMEPAVLSVTYLEG